MRFAGWERWDSGIGDIVVKREILWVVGAMSDGEERVCRRWRFEAVVVMAGHCHCPLERQVAGRYG